MWQFIVADFHEAALSHEEIDVLESVLKSFEHETATAMQ